jgi:hypothetical protein
MVQSLAAQHRARAAAAVNAAVSPTRQTVIRPARQGLLWAALEADIARLKAVRSQQRKAAIKREILPKYADHLSGIINGTDFTHNETLVVLCVWAFDAGEWGTALKLAAFALQHGMKSPEGFKRSLPETLLEEAALQAKHQHHPSHLRDYLTHLQELTHGADIADEVTAKFNKAWGLTLEPTNPAAALLAYQTAQHYGAAVQRNLKRLAKQGITA